jgi:glycerol-3-phosphate dehydrogenase
VAAELGTGLASARSPTRALRLRAAHAGRARRPAWSELDARGAPRLGDDLLRAAWSRRYAAFAAEVERLCAGVADGRRALDPETQLGELDWAVAHEDCLSAEDFLLRRTDLAYGPRTAAEEAGRAVLERLARLSAWSAPRQAEEARRLERALARIHAWRGDPA